MFSTLLLEDLSYVFVVRTRLQALSKERSLWQGCRWRSLHITKSGSKLRFESKGCLPSPTDLYKTHSRPWQAPKTEQTRIKRWENLEPQPKSMMVAQNYSNMKNGVSDRNRIRCEVHRGFLDQGWGKGFFTFLPQHIFAKYFDEHVAVISWNERGSFKTASYPVRSKKVVFSIGNAFKYKPSRLGGV